jgi:hypothetical protein
MVASRICGCTPRMAAFRFQALSVLGRIDVEPPVGTAIE